MIGKKRDRLRVEGSSIKQSKDQVGLDAFFEEKCDDGLNLGSGEKSGDCS